MAVRKRQKGNDDSLHVVVERRKLAGREIQKAGRRRQTEEGKNENVEAGRNGNR